MPPGLEQWSTLGEMFRADPRRLEACWRACLGLPTAALESGAVRQALTAAREGLEAPDTRREVEADVQLVAALDALGMAPVDAQDWLGRAIAPPPAREGG